MTDEREDLLPPEGVGHVFQKGREEQGLDQAAAARLLNLNLQMIQALETDDMDRLPPPSFTRGYIRAYAKLLEMEPEQLIDIYNRIAPEEPKLGSFGEQAARQSQSKSPAGIRWFVLLIALATITLAGLWWYDSKFDILPSFPINLDTSRNSPTQVPPSPDSETGQGQEISALDQTLQADVPNTSTVQAGASVAATESEQTAAAATADATVGATNNATNNATDDNANEGTDNEPSAAQERAAGADSDNDPASPPVSTTNDPTTNSTTSTAADAPSNAATASETQASGTEPSEVKEDNFDIRTETSSWVEVVDATGKRLMYGMLEQSRSRTLSGKAPFLVFLGNTPGISMRMNGNDVEPPEYSARSKTSRFIIYADGSRQN